MKKTFAKIGLYVFSALLLLPILTQLTFAEVTAPPIIPKPASQDGSDKPDPNNTTANLADQLVIPHSTGGTTDEGAYLTSTYLPALTQSIIGIAGGMAFLFIIIGGIQILTAYGEEEKITNARKTITYAIVGLIISILSYAIVSIISNIRLMPATAPDQGSQEWQDANKGLDEGEQADKTASQEAATQAGVQDVESYTAEELQDMGF